MTRRHSITSKDGAQLAVFDHGPKDAPTIVLIHGWSQCHLSWDRQLPLGSDHRLIIPDLRGHGASGKPQEAEAYNTSAPWADDIEAIISQLSLSDPVLVGWSMGGLVVMDYLRVHGDAKVGGLMLVGCGVTTGRYAPKEAQAQRASDDAVVAQGMYETDLCANLDATVAFVKACFHQQPSTDDLARMVGFNMLVPPAIRAAARLRHEDHRETAAAVSRPAMLLNGARDRMARSSMIDEAQEALPGAARIDLANCGHSSFWEDSERFNHELASFAARVRTDPPFQRSPSIS